MLTLLMKNCVGIDPVLAQEVSDFTLCQVEEFVDRIFPSMSCDLQEIQERGVEMPFPQRTVHIREETG
jgi:hypothetical protein